MKANTPVTKFHEEWQKAKAEHPDVVLLFRIADHLEAFFEDAELLEKVFGLRCTRWDKIPMAGFPVHQGQFVERLKHLGHRVGIYTLVEIPQSQNIELPPNHRAYVFEEK